MSNYKITEYSFKKAKKLNLVIKVSINPSKKIDVYKDNVYLASIGDSQYMDYPNYIRIYGQIYANERKRLYVNRHTINANIIYSKQWLSLNLLW